MSVTGSLCRLPDLRVKHTNICLGTRLGCFLEVACLQASCSSSFETLFGLFPMWTLYRIISSVRRKASSPAFFFFAISLNLMMKRQGILSNNKKQLRFCCTVPNNPRRGILPFICCSRKCNSATSCNRTTR